MFDLVRLQELTKLAMKNKKSTLPIIEIKWMKRPGMGDGWVCFVNDNQTSSCGVYATAELMLLIQGAAPWQLDMIAQGRYPRMDHTYPDLKDLQLLSYHDYMKYLEKASIKA